MSYFSLHIYTALCKLSRELHIPRCPLTSNILTSSSNRRFTLSVCPTFLERTLNDALCPNSILSIQLCPPYRLHIQLSNVTWPCGTPTALSMSRLSLILVFYRYLSKRWGAFDARGINMTNLGTSCREHRREATWCVEFIFAPNYTH